MGTAGRGRPASEVTGRNNFGAWLRKLRNERGLTGEALVFRIGGGITQSSISYYERGKKKPEAPTVFLIAKALGVDPREAFEALRKDMEEGDSDQEIERIPDPEREFWVGAYDGLTENRRKILLELARQLRQDEKNQVLG